MIEDDVSEAGENEFPALTDVQEAMVASALVRNPASQVLSEGFKLQLTRADFYTLSGLNWLNDEVSTKQNQHSSCSLITLHFFYFSNRSSTST